jgi:hypothetical protein
MFNLAQTMILVVRDLVIKLLLLVVGTTLLLGFSQRLTTTKVYLLTVCMVGSLSILQKHLSQ